MVRLTLTRLQEVHGPLTGLVVSTGTFIVPLITWFIT